MLAQGRQVFRPRWILALATGLAAGVWSAALVFLLATGFGAAGTVAAAAGFALFFAMAALYYGRSAIFVDGSGLTVRSLLRTQRFGFSEILKLDVLPGPVIVYSVRARGRLFHFTSFFRRHRDLASLMLERAGLSAQQR